jgi:hypothetical protein
MKSFIAFLAGVVSVSTAAAQYVTVAASAPVAGAVTCSVWGTAMNTQPLAAGPLPAWGSIGCSIPPVIGALSTHW